MLLSRVDAALSRCLTENQAKQIHAQILVNSLWDLEIDLVRQFVASQQKFTPTGIRYVQNALLHMQCDDCSLWSSVIRSCSQNGQFREAVSLFVQMRKLGLDPTTYSISSSLRSCARLNYKVGGTSIHAQVHQYGIVHSVHVQTAVLDFYAKLGDMAPSEKVFDEIGEKNVVSWNSLLGGYLKSRDVAKANQLFDEIPIRNVVSWNSMISGYAKSGDMDKAQVLFYQMPDKNSTSWNAMISGYVDWGKITMAQSLFDAMPQRNRISWISLISGYSKCGDVYSAQNLFHLMPEKDVSAFNSMITCYAQNNRPKEAIHLFNTMLSEFSIQPDKITLACVISACSQIGDLNSGSWIESYIRRIGINVDDHIATALVDLYAKCGSLDKAYKWFNALRRRDLVA